MPRGVGNVSVLDSRSRRAARASSISSARPICCHERRRALLRGVSECEGAALSVFGLTPPWRRSLGRPGKASLAPTKTSSRERPAIPTATSAAARIGAMPATPRMEFTGARFSVRSRAISSSSIPRAQPDGREDACDEVHPDAFHCYHSQRRREFAFAPGRGMGAPLPRKAVAA